MQRVLGEDLQRQQRLLAVARDEEQAVVGAGPEQDDDHQNEMRDEQ